MQSRVCIVPTWRGWLVILVVAVVSVTLFTRGICGFLTIEDPAPGGVLVIEGWVPPYAAREAVQEYHRHAYVGVYVTGEPLEEGDANFPKYDNSATVTAAKVLEMGLPEGVVHAVPAPGVGRDRTYTMAMTLKRRLHDDGVSTARLNVYSFGPHSRRSRLLYEFAFGPDTKIGMVAVQPHEFDPDHWWKTSAGVRYVVGELIAYVYARLVFHPGEN